MFSFAAFFNTVILLGTLQGFIICCLLLYSKKNRLPNRLLARLIFLMSLASLNLYGNAIAATKKRGSIAAVLTGTAIDETVLLLKKSMEEDKIYLNPNCSLHLLANHTGIAQKTISSVLNQHLQKSFNEFINQYRVEAVKIKLQQPETVNLTIAGIATECGFNSQATFQRTFKDLTGMSPSEFRKLVVNPG